MIKLNAAGKSDPLPLVREALAKGAEEIEVSSVDTAPALKIKQFMEGKGFSVQIQDDNGRLTLTCSHSALPAAPHEQRAAQPRAVPTSPALSAPLVGPRKNKSSTNTARRPRPTYLILDRALGRGSPEEGQNAELGEILMKGFLNALTKASRPPEAVILIN